MCYQVPGFPVASLAFLFLFHSVEFRYISEQSGAGPFSLTLQYNVLAQVVLLVSIHMSRIRIDMVTRT